eukprot:gene10752-7647_t
MASPSEEVRPMGQAPSTETEEQRQWRQRLQHATEAEFGPSLVQRWLVEATAADESAGASTALAVQLEAHASSQARIFFVSSSVRVLVVSLVEEPSVTVFRQYLK